jgi:hypothetical protein
LAEIWLLVWSLALTADHTPARCVAVAVAVAVATVAVWLGGWVAVAVMGCRMSFEWGDLEQYWQRYGCLGSGSVAVWQWLMWLWLCSSDSVAVSGCGNGCDIYRKSLE